ncbi:phosphoenolpyruvate--protein phosphotransferase [Adlercreutzia caecimuris]|uniref:Phosphoenolpyruvate-protein phosphotransferase n=1 Tax=Adlercreutzia caecimuris B7 TaxID=1235794 RepID=R9KWG9_9ACTN|nr:phosphoenolpyruvate--protein phosphotransferase [Adlercreutzia caecimuris]EOS50638.1 phosphoenolpyruvate-protein phosphotransferase [Adlercreutzia caecimuris B7]MCI9207022.1 phosphoenolpyruvate--protein phosphotransferase [Adlercreutzia caecimuris]NBJ65880.1 phosphoenolpyruvate--protein phosphotransferase [Adlercreutzia caecimuris]
MAALAGVAASPGLGIGTVMVIAEPCLAYEAVEVTDAEAEKSRLHGAIEAFSALTREKAEVVRERVGDAEAAILEGHVLMISDPFMVAEMDNLIDGGQCAEAALDTVCETFAVMFEAADDDLTRQRAADVRDIKSGVLCQLLGVREVDVSRVPRGTVLVTHDLVPSMTAGLDRDNVVGIVTETGGMTSHSAILARALEIPAVLAVPDAVRKLPEGAQVIVDGGEGTVAVAPDEAELAAARVRQEALRREKEALQRFVGKKTVTADGCQVELFGNIGSVEDARAVVDNDGEGVGLFRTEFLFMDGGAMPTEEEQFRAYQQAALIMKGRPVIIRTLDIGGDKDIPYLGLEKEDNPFMGFRAIRYCLAREDVFRTQLRALLRASAFGDVRIMVPLVTGVEELRQVRALIRRYADEFSREGVACNKDVPVGVMIETPAAALMADALAAEADFFSIGTNDLTGYTMAVDRGNDRVRYLYSAFNPAVLRSIRSVIAAGTAAGIPVGMCGEAAADPLLIPLWISFGLTEYSVGPASILATRAAIAGWRHEEARALAEAVMGAVTPDAVFDLLKAAAR